MKHFPKLLYLFIKRRCWSPDQQHISKIFFLFLFLSQQSFSNNIQQNLFLNRGTFIAVNSTTFSFLAFNSTSNFISRNEDLSFLPYDSITFNIHNNDTAIHGFAVKNYAGSVTIAAGDSANFLFTSSTNGLFIYYDNFNYPTNRYLGAAGIISINNYSGKKYFWNMKEHESMFTDTIVQGGIVNWNNYEPDFFTINGLSYPDIQNDTTSKIVAHVGDTIHIYIANTGQSLHSLHFHGFHCRAIYSSSTTIGIDWVKDTYAIRSMETCILELVPDKVGLYSVHDHNLAALSGGGTHPNGMFTIMLIQ